MLIFILWPWYMFYLTFHDYHFHPHGISNNQWLVSRAALPPDVSDVNTTSNPHFHEMWLSWHGESGSSEVLDRWSDGPPLSSEALEPAGIEADKKTLHHILVPYSLVCLPFLESLHHVFRMKPWRPGDVTAHREDKKQVENSDKQAKWLKARWEFGNKNHKKNVFAWASSNL